MTRFPSMISVFAILLVLLSVCSDCAPQSTFEDPQLSELRVTLQKQAALHHKTHLSLIKRYLKEYYLVALGYIEAYNNASDEEKDGIVPDGWPLEMDQMYDYIVWAKDKDAEATDALYWADMDLTDARNELNDYVSEIVTVQYAEDKEALSNEIKFQKAATIELYSDLERDFTNFQSTLVDIKKHYGVGKSGQTVSFPYDDYMYNANMGLGNYTIYEERLSEISILESTISEIQEVKNVTDTSGAIGAASQFSSLGGDKKKEKSKLWLAAYIAIPTVVAGLVAGALVVLIQKRRNAAAQDGRVALNDQPAQEMVPVGNSQV